MGGNAPGTIDGLAGPFATAANLVYYMTVDDAGGAGNAGRKTGNIVNVNNKKVIDTATTPRRGGETMVGHALQKHAGRKPDVWGKVKVGPNEINNSALSHLEDMLDVPGNFTAVITSKGTKFLEKKLPDGRGVRLELNGNFKGFID